MVHRGAKGRYLSIRGYCYGPIHLQLFFKYPVTTGFFSKFSIATGVFNWGFLKLKTPVKTRCNLRIFKSLSCRWTEPMYDYLEWCIMNGALCSICVHAVWLASSTVESHRLEPYFSWFSPHSKSFFCQYFLYWLASAAFKNTIPLFSYHYWDTSYACGSVEVTHSKSCVALGSHTHTI